MASLSGCQTLSNPFQKIAARKAPRGSSLTEPAELPSGEVTAKQKADVQMALARSLERQGALDRAITAYQEVVRNDDSRADALHRLAVVHDRKGEFQTSERFYRAARSLDPNNAELLCDWGYRCYLQRDFQEAEANLRKALSLHDGLARAHNNLGLVLARTGRCDEALSEFAKAGCSEPDARSNLALALSLEGRSEAAREQFAFALRGGSTSSAARVARRVLKGADGPTRGAIEARASTASDHASQLTGYTSLQPNQGSPLVTDAHALPPGPPGSVQPLPPVARAAVTPMYPATADVPQWEKARR